jgi:hypothetical protein
MELGMDAWEAEMDISELPAGIHVVQRKTRNNSPEFYKILKISR